MNRLGIRYLIDQLGLIDDYFMDSDNSDRLEELADGSILLCPEILRAKRGESFRYFPAGEKKSVIAEPIENSVYYHYMNIFQNCEMFGIPHGQGWANELPWLLDFLAHFKSLNRKIEEWHHAKAMAKFK